MDKLDKRAPKEIRELYEMIGDEINDMLAIIYKKTGYYTTGQFSLYADEPKKCMNIQLDIALLEFPHDVNLDKLTYYSKHNPDNCLNKPIRAFEHNTWYMIYDGCHRTQVNKDLGKKNMIVNIIVPKPDKEV